MDEDECRAHRHESGEWKTTGPVSSRKRHGSLAGSVAYGEVRSPIPATPRVTVQTRYQIGEIIGRGGMGEVRLADDVMLHRKVALKFVTEGGGTDGLERLLGEARAAA